jgi:NADP-dependent 3-hydroxy acid dehydrogenase YdfG
VLPRFPYENTFIASHARSGQWWLILFSLGHSILKPSAIIIGASSGIGLELCRHLAAKDYRIGIAARRKSLLDETAASLPQVSCVSKIDLSQPDEALQYFEAILECVAPVDFVYLCAGTGHLNPDLIWKLEEETIRINTLGFAALASRTITFFLKQGHGHLVGITSVAAVRGSSAAPAYGATKAFESHYLESLRIRARRSGTPIFVTEIRPWFCGYGDDENRLPILGIHAGCGCQPDCSGGGGSQVRCLCDASVAFCGLAIETIAR